VTLFAHSELEDSDGPNDLEDDGGSGEEGLMASGHAGIMEIK
jgi:hypothetical protein